MGGGSSNPISISRTHPDSILANVTPLSPHRFSIGECHPSFVRCSGSTTSYCPKRRDLNLLSGSRAPEGLWIGLYAYLDFDKCCLIMIGWWVYWWHSNILKTNDSAVIIRIVEINIKNLVSVCCEHPMMISHNDRLKYLPFVPMHDGVNHVGIRIRKKCTAYAYTCNKVGGSLNTTLSACDFISLWIENSHLLCKYDSDTTVCQYVSVSVDPWEAETTMENVMFNVQCIGEQECVWFRVCTAVRCNSHMILCWKL